MLCCGIGNTLPHRKSLSSKAVRTEVEEQGEPSERWVGEGVFVDSRL